MDFGAFAFAHAVLLSSLPDTARELWKDNHVFFLDDVPLKNTIVVQPNPINLAWTGIEFRPLFSPSTTEGFRATYCIFYVSNALACLLAIASFIIAFLTPRARHENRPIILPFAAGLLFLVSILNLAVMARFLETGFNKVLQHMSLATMFLTFMFDLFLGATISRVIDRSTAQSLRRYVSPVVFYFIMGIASLLLAAFFITPWIFKMYQLNTIKEVNWKQWPLDSFFVYVAILGFTTLALMSVAVTGFLIQKTRTAVTVIAIHVLMLLIIDTILRIYTAARSVYYSGALGDIDSRIFTSLPSVHATLTGSVLCLLALAYFDSGIRRARQPNRNYEDQRDYEIGSGPRSKSNHYPSTPQPAASTQASNAGFASNKFQELATDFNREGHKGMDRGSNLVNTGDSLRGLP